MDDSGKSPVPSSDAVPEKSGLPAISADIVEQDFPADIDNIVPSRGYDRLPMVALGGSAGSIQALHQFFRAMPPTSGFAFVVILHLSPEHESTLAEVLSRSTAMPVVQALESQEIEANTVYVIPPGKHLLSLDGRLKLVDLEPERGKRVAVDVFFRTLADTHGPHATAIVLSGADGDGAIGIKRIKERGGLTIAQDPDEAEHPSMPRSSIDTGMVDWVLRVAQMPPRLLEYREKEAQLRLPPEDGPQPASPAPGVPTDDERALREVLAFLRARTGRDFSYYKRATIIRRVSRRLQVNGVTTLPDYLTFLRMHPGETGALLQDLLISVTNFFRDRDSFKALEERLPELFVGKGAGDVIRAWVPACATGEEAYSIGMMFLEHAGTLDSPPSIQVFATDLDEDVVASARDALYPATISADVSEDRLRRFFSKEHRGYRIRRELRECVLFAVHDLLKDAPFSRLDLVSCRNLLIYLTRAAQRRALDIFHFTLRPRALLFLGSSETIDEGNKSFEVLDKRHRLYAPVAAVRTNLPVPIGPSTLTRAFRAQEQARGGPFIHGAAFERAAIEVAQHDADLHEAQRISWEELHFKLIERFAPPSLIVTRDYEIVHVSEQAGRFLHFSGGEPSVNLLRVVHPMLRVELRAALFRAAQTSMPAEVFRVPVELEGQTVQIDLRVAPAQEIAPDYLLVVFQLRETAGEPAALGETANRGAEPAVRYLEREIEQMKSRLRETVEQYEVSTEELKASNEELQAMNEELRSATEELETGREELQSINEELTTVNSELKGKVDELGHSNSDLANLMAATAIATIFLDRQLRIMRYTPTAVALFQLIPSDLGRPLTDLAHRLNYPEMSVDAEQVLATLVPKKREVSDGEGHWFLAQILPYRTADDHIAGMVLTFVDITETRNAELARAEIARALKRHSRLFDITLSSIADFAYTFDRAGRFTFANRPLLELLGRPLEEVAGRNFHDLNYPPALAEKLQAQIEHVFTTGEIIRDDTAFTSPTGEDGFYEYIFRPVHGADGTVELVAGSTRDVTERKQGELALRASEERLRLATDAVQMFSWEIDLATGAFTASENAARVLPFPLPARAIDLIGAVHPDDVPGVRRALEETLARCGQFEIEYRLNEALAGGELWVFSAGLVIAGPDRTPARAVGVTQNITARRGEQRALRESQERLRLIVENARDYAIFSLDLERHITSWNPGAERILGYTAEEALGRAGDIIFTPEDVATGVPEQEAGKALVEGRAADERWHICKDGTRFWGSGVMMAMHDAGGKAIGLVKIFRDQTAELHAKEALERSREELWAALQETERARAEAESAGLAKDHFLAVLSHELRTPLTPVLMAVRTLMRHKELPPTAIEALEMIQRNVQLEAHFVDDLLDVTRIARGKLEIIREPMDVHEAIRHAVQVTTSDIEGKSQRLTVALDAAEHHLVGDATRLQQVFWNLLKNASKFTPEGGVISVRSRNGPGRITIEFTDTGIGFEPGDAERIFDAFAQANEAITREFGGLGLGLAISKATLDAHGGSLEAKSAGRDRGATFSVELPLG